MICLMDGGSGLSIATIVFYTCVWIPVKQMKQAILDLFSSIFQQLIHHGTKIGFSCDDYKNSSSRSSSSVILNLVPAEKFKEVCCSGGGGGGESCSICLAEYDGEDMVIRLPRCGHVFHMECINSWLDRSQFTCPLCRDLFLCSNVHAR